LIEADFPIQSNDHHSKNTKTGKQAPHTKTENQMNTIDDKKSNNVALSRDDQITKKTKHKKIIIYVKIT
jgi:hypothetical protein